MAEEKTPVNEVNQLLLKKREDEEIDSLAAEAFYFCCAARSKDGKNPFEVCGNFNELVEQSKEFYRNIARWHLSKR